VVSAAGTYQMAGLPLGPFDASEYPAALLFLEPGDCIIAFTDGVTEATAEDGRQLENAGIRAAIEGASRSPREMVGAVVQAIRQFTGGQPQSDDITLVAFGRKP
jgi:sigma-B regulation protein RsbU (phosphoserine phosphatase)